MTAGPAPTLRWCADSWVTGTVVDDGLTPALRSAPTCDQNVAVLPHRRSGETVLSEDNGWAPGYTMGLGPIHLDEVSCTGKEPSLLLCNKREWLQHDCTHWEDVHVACGPERSGQSLPSSEFHFHSNGLAMKTGIK